MFLVFAYAQPAMPHIATAKMLIWALIEQAAERAVFANNQRELIFL